MLQRPVQSLSVINSRPIDSLKEGPDSILRLHIKSQTRSCILGQNYRTAISETRQTQFANGRPPKENGALETSIDNFQLTF